MNQLNSQIQLNSHEFAGAIAMLAYLPEVFNQIVSDDDYEDLLTGFGEVLARFMKVPMVGLIPPEPSRPGYTLIFQTPPPSEDDIEAGDVPRMLPIEPYRAAISAMLHALAEQIR